MSTVDTITVNWNTGGQLRQCLRALEQTPLAAHQLARVVVVDNASRDGSLAGLESLALPLVLIRNQTNRGFGAACNQGADGSTADYLLLLNPDTQIQGDALAQALTFLDAHPKYGIVGAQLVDEAGHISRSCARFMQPVHVFNMATGLSKLSPRRFPDFHMREWDHHKSREVDHVMGSFYLIRRSVFEEVDGFDERFFMYLEDLDLSLRAREAGWRSYYLADAQVYHAGGGASRHVKARRLSYTLHSRIRYAFKHFGLPGRVLVLFMTVFVEPFPRLARALLINRSAAEAWQTAQGWAMLWRRLAGDLLNL